jgi:hypothetical protein
MTDLNSGKEWTPMDLSDLQNSLAQGCGLEETAQFLCRDVGEVLAKMSELGLPGRLARQGAGVE